MNNDWHEWRKNGIGSSDAAVLMNGNHFGKTPHDLYLEKISEKAVMEGNIYTQHGKDYEPYALRWFQDQKGCALLTDVRSENPTRPWIRATLDGIDQSKKYLVEAKCPYNLENHQKVKQSRKVPVVYFPQCQHQMIVEELDGMYFLSYNYKDPDDSVILEVERDNQYIKRADEVYEEFWERVQKRIPPEDPEENYTCMEGNKRWKVVSKQLLQVRGEKKALDDKDKEFVEELKSLSQGRSAKGYGLVLQKQVCAGAVDYSKVPELQGVNLELYRKSSFEKWVPRAI